MQLELPVRWAETDLEGTKTEELIKGDGAKEKIKYVHGTLLINASDIGPYYDLDPNNTVINDKLGKVYIVTIPIHQFKKIMTEITGNAIMLIQVRTEDNNHKPPSRRGPQAPNDDILL